MPLLDESMENLTCDLVIDEELFRGDLNVYRICFTFSHACQFKRNTNSNEQLAPLTALLSSR